MRDTSSLGRSTSRSQPLGGFVALAVAAGASIDVPVTPPEGFKGRKPVVPSNLAPSFVINSLKVGNKPQLGSAGGVPALCFSEQVKGDTDIEMDHCAPAIPITFNVTNVSGAAADFRAAIWGEFDE